MKKKVYICAPLGGQVKKNIQKAIRYTEYALKQGVAPITTHFYALCLDDNNPAERKLGMEAGQSLLWFCDEMWIFGTEISAGMNEEIQFCKNLRIPMKRVGDKDLKKVLGGNLNEEDEANSEMVDSVCDHAAAADADIYAGNHNLSFS